MTFNNRPLSGITVIELATFVAAPTCGRALADWGANVIKIESPKGDPMRMMGSLVNMPVDDEENVAYDQQNSNKRGIVLNLKEKEGMEILHRMLESADVFITNNRQDALVKMGLSYEQLSTRYKGLVYGHILGYGEKGPDKDRPGFDFTAYYARGGIIGTLYEKGTSPVLTVAGFGDHQAGLYLASGICAALFNAKRTGAGEKVSVSLYHTAVFGMAHMIASAQYGNPYPRSRRDTANPLQAIYETRDGRWLQLAIAQYDAELPRVCRLMGREELADDERYNSFRAVKDSPGEMIGILEEEFKKKDIDEWIKIFNDADLACDKAALWEEILEDEQAWADEILSKVGGYMGGEERIVVNSPVKFKNAGVPKFNKGPKIGENTAEVLAEYTYTKEQIDGLKKQGIVK